jgi:CheY-like chemotaxis protein
VRVLVVDDEADAREMLKEILVHDGATVETAASARQALETLSWFDPDVLVSDIGMPVEDGYSLIREVRKLPGGRSRVPAVALTAYARPEDARRVIDAGYQRHVAKPTNPDTLAGAIAELAARSTRSMLPGG